MEQQWQQYEIDTIFVICTDADMLLNHSSEADHSLVNVTVINPCPPTRVTEKGGKGRETYKLNIKFALLIILIMRERKWNVQN